MPAPYGLPLSQRPLAARLAKDPKAKANSACRYSHIPYCGLLGALAGLEAAEAGIHPLYGRDLCEQLHLCQPELSNLWKEYMSKC